jgi:hypothetical protein
MFMAQCINSGKLVLGCMYTVFGYGFFFTVIREGAYHFCLRLVSKWAFRFYDYCERVNLPFILFEISDCLSESASNGRQCIIENSSVVNVLFHLSVPSLVKLSVW